MIRYILNRILKAPGSYRVKDKKIYRELSLGFSYCCMECESTLEALRISSQLSSIR